MKHSNPSLRPLLPSALWSLAGTLLPMGAALLAVPWLLTRLGQERVGVLSLIWVVVGYFSFLDMGLGRALTVEVARLRAQPERLGAQWALLGSALALLGALSLAACLPLAAWTAWGPLPWAVSGAALADEVRQALLWTLPAIPLLVLASALRGHLEGLGAFRALNLLRIPTGVALAAVPCLSALWRPDLRWLCAGLLGVRLLHLILAVGVLAHCTATPAARLLRQCLHGVALAPMRRLWGLGSWVTVSNVVGPVIVYLDRFLIGSVLGAAAVAAYVLPFDLISRLPLLVGALAAVLLPEVARTAASAHPAQPRALWRQSSVLSLLALVPIVALGWVLMPWALSAWLGPSFMHSSTEVARILLLAFALNALAQIPFAALQGLGQMRAVALLHLSEILPYALTVVWAVRTWGLSGAAWAWLLRGGLDYAVLLALLARSSRAPHPAPA